MNPIPHRWNFLRAGGIDQVVIRSGADVANLEHLDQKLWVALACPTRGVWFDPRTLDLIDTDGDGRIRPPELVAVSRWVRDTSPTRTADAGRRPRAARRHEDDTEAGRAWSTRRGRCCSWWAGRTPPICARRLAERARCFAGAA